MANPELIVQNPPALALQKTQNKTKNSREKHTKHRDLLEKKYERLITHNPQLKRTLVSFQANKTIPFYGWFKYKEGFSAQMVHYILKTLAKKPGRLLDPFAGAGTALFASQELGWAATGIELLPVGCAIIEARQATKKIDPAEFQKAMKSICDIDFSTIRPRKPLIKHIGITEGAFPQDTEEQLNGYLAYCSDEINNPYIRTILRFAAFCILENISYTRKDGQYLRWDYRAGKNRVKTKFNKGKIYSFKEALQLQLETMLKDLTHDEMDLFESKRSKKKKEIKLVQGSCLEKLCKHKDHSFDFILTSPPYCNRYDYTRTYALELIFLHKTNDEVKRLRQQMLSCTVENRDKIDSLRAQYEKIQKEDFLEKAIGTFNSHSALQEVLYWLNVYNKEGMLNNSNIPRMVANYFLEMALVIFEMSRVLRVGGKIVMVNDNVRYSGEEVPVDLILSDFAEAAGLSTRNIWILGTGKGNSSQQMEKYGRAELRKCVYVWEKT